MSSARGTQNLRMIISVLLALALSIMPLPSAVEAYRPDWVILILVYWALASPHKYSVGTAWLIGLIMDVAQGTLLGQHALVMCVIVFITIKFHLLMRVFPILQLTLAIAALLSIYQFLLFWINGVAGVTVPGVVYWGPIITGTIIWPALSMFMNGLRFGRG